LLGQPDAGAQIAVKHLTDGVELNVEDVQLLGSDEKCDWTCGDGALKVAAPSATEANKIATVFKVKLK